MSQPARFRAAIERLAHALQMTAGIVLLLAAIGVTANALLRYGFHRDIAVLTEQGGFLFLFVVFFGLAATFAAGSHISVELLSAIAPHKVARFAYDVVVPVLSMIFVGTVLVTGAMITQRYFVTGRLTMGSVQIPFWLFVAIVPIGCIAMELTLLSRLMDGLHAWNRPDRNPEPN